ncbi:Tbc1d2 [Scenedesmus sp. PABB004]|nr:Tbc1d2 [Scenedesmus sp. PABB004]
MAAMAEPEPEQASDLYGFAFAATLQQQAVRLQADGAARRAEAAWLPFAAAQRLPPEHRLKDMVRAGVPPTLRPWVWTAVSGAGAKAAAAPLNHFADMASAGAAPGARWLADIDADLDHSFPAHALLQAPDGRAALRRVLAAFSAHDPAVGYVRGMNAIAALLLLAANRRGTARRPPPARGHRRTASERARARAAAGAQERGHGVEMLALRELLTKKLPRLAAHLDALDADVSMFATDWFLTLFATSLPAETVMRVWDSVFFEGAKVIFRVALALLQAHEPALLACDDLGELVMAVRGAAAGCHDRDGLMEGAFSGIGSLPMAVIERHREARSAEVAAAVRERQALRNRQALRGALDAQLAPHGELEAAPAPGQLAAALSGAREAAATGMGWPRHAPRAAPPRAPPPRAPPRAAPHAPAARTPQSAATLQTPNPGSVESFELLDPAVQTADPGELLSTDDGAAGGEGALAGAAHAAQRAAERVGGAAARSAHNAATDPTYAMTGAHAAGERAAEALRRAAGRAAGSAREAGEGAAAAAADAAGGAREAGADALHRAGETADAARQAAADQADEAARRGGDLGRGQGRGQAARRGRRRGRGRRGRGPARPCRGAPPMVLAEPCWPQRRPWAAAAPRPRSRSQAAASREVSEQALEAEAARVQGGGGEEDERDLVGRVTDAIKGLRKPSVEL